MLAGCVGAVMRRPWVNKERLGHSARRIAALPHGSNSSCGDKNVHQTSATATSNPSAAAPTRSVKHSQARSAPRFQPAFYPNTAHVSSGSTNVGKVRSLIWRLHRGALSPDSEQEPPERLRPALPASATHLAWLPDDLGGRFLGRELGVETLKVSTDIRPLPSRFTVSTRVSLVFHKDGAVQEAALISGRIG